MSRKKKRKTQGWKGKQPSKTGRIIRFSFFAALILLVWTYLFFLSDDRMLYSKKGIFRDLPICLILVALPFLGYQMIHSLKRKYSDVTDVAMLVASIIPIATGITFGIMSGKWAEQDFEKYGVEVKGVISVRKHTTGRHSRWIVKGQFEVNGKVYETFSETDHNDSYHIGDSVMIRYSSRNPENNELLLSEYPTR